MLICRYHTKNGPQFGLIRDEHVFQLIGSPFLDEPKQGEVVGRLDEVRLLAPMMPGKIICVGRNYVAHAEELGNEVPDTPLTFFKPPSAVIGTGAEIQLLSEMGRVDHEAELALVMKKAGRFISQDEAIEYVLGYTCANDISDRDFQKTDGQWARAKGFDTFLPLGPWINTDLSPDKLRLTCKVNGEVKQDSNTELMVYRIHFLIEYVSRVMTLEPGDMILTGTPAGVSPLSPGDEVTVEIEGIGILSNPVVKLNR